MRVLEDDLHIPAQAPHRPVAERRDVLAVERDRPALGLDQAQDHAGDRRFAGARFADDPQNLAGPDGELDAVDGPHLAPSARVEDLDEAGARRSGDGGRGPDQARVMVARDAVRGSARRMAGRSVVQIAVAWAQRGWKRHPSADRSGSGSCPARLGGAGSRRRSPAGREQAARIRDGADAPAPAPSGLPRRRCRRT